MPDSPSTLPADFFDGLPPDSIPVGSPQASQMTDQPGLPEVIPVGSPDLVSVEDRLRALPESDIARAFHEDTKKGVAVDRKFYEDAYALRAGEANWTGSEDLTPGAQHRTAAEVLKQAAGAMWQGAKTVAAEATILATGHAPVRDSTGFQLLPVDNTRVNQAIGNLVNGLAKDGLETLHMYDRTLSKVYNQLTEWGLNDPAKARSILDSQFNRDVEMEKTYDDLRRGVPLGLVDQKPSGEQILLPVDPKKVEEVSDTPVGLDELLPFGAAFKAAKGATKTEKLAAKTLGRLDQEVPSLAARMAAKPLDYAAGIAGFTEKFVGSSPIARAATVGGVTLASGADMTGVLLASIIANSDKLDKGLQALEKGAKASANAIRSPGGPISRFSADVYRWASGPTAKGVVSGSLANAPYALGAGSQAEFEDAIAIGAISTGAGIGAQKVRSGLDISQNFFAPAAPDVSARQPVKDLGLSATLDAEHRRVMDQVNNDGNNFVEDMRAFSRKAGLGEIYAVSFEGFKNALTELAQLDPTLNLAGKDISAAAANQGVTLEVKMPDGKTRKVALFAVRDNMPGLGAGHEAMHLVDKALSQEQRENIYARLAEDYRPEGIEAARQKYAQDLGVNPKTLSDTYVIAELFAETGAAVLNSIPPGSFGPNRSKSWKQTVRQVYGMVGEVMSKIGYKVPETAVRQDYKGADGNTYTRWVSPGTSGPKTGLGFDPSIKGARMIENVLQAMSLEEGVFDTEAPGQAAAQVDETPADKPNIPGVRPAVAPPAFAKGLVLEGGVKDATGKFVGDKVEILAVTPSTLKADDHTYLVRIRVGKNTWEAEVKQSDLQNVNTGAPSEAAPAAAPTPTPAPAQTSGVPAPAPAPTPTPAPAQNARGVTDEQRAALEPKLATADVQRTNEAIIKAEVAKPLPEQQLLGTDYFSVKLGEPSEKADIREARRLAAQAEQSKGAKGLMALYNKLVKIYQYEPNPKNGKPFATAFAFDNFIANVQLVDGWLRQNAPASPLLEKINSPEFVKQARAYWDNQANGYRGDGEKMVRKTAEGVPPENPNYTPVKLDRGTVEAVNLLMGIEHPLKNTAVSAAMAQVARENGLAPVVNAEGVELPNATLAGLEAAGFNPRILHSTVQHLSLDKMTTPLTPSGIKGISTPVTTTIRAGFMPAEGSLAVTNAGIFEQVADKFSGSPARGYSSGNAWGFGGSTGKVWESTTKDGLPVVVKVATAYVRHGDPTKFITVTLDGRRIFDETQGPKAFQEAALVLQQIEERHGDKPTGQFMPGARPSGASPTLPPPKLGAFTERAPRPRAEEDAFSRHSSFVATSRGVVLHSAKLRSTAFIRPDGMADFKSEIAAAKTPEAKDRVIESYFMPAVREFSGDATQLQAALQRPGWAILTATREDWGDASSRKNVEANQALRDHLERNGIPYIDDISGRYKGVDQGSNVLILAPESEAKKLGRRFGQESVLTHRGLIYSDGRPSTPSHGRILTGNEALASDFYSVMPSGEAFTFELDFSPDDGTGAVRKQSFQAGDRVVVANSVRAERGETATVLEAIKDPVKQKPDTGGLGEHARYILETPDGRELELYDYELRKADGLANLEPGRFMPGDGADVTPESEGTRVERGMSLKNFLGPDELKNYADEKRDILESTSGVFDPVGQNPGERGKRMQALNDKYHLWNWRNELPIGPNDRGTFDAQFMPAVDELGFYSNTAEAVERWQAKGTPEQLLAHLAKTAGAKEEAAWMGLDDFLKDKKSVTKEEVANFVRENTVRLKEVQKQAVTKYDDYTLPGGENYREILITKLAPDPLTLSERERFRELGQYDVTSSRFNRAAFAKLTVEELQKFSDERSKLWGKIRSASVERGFNSSHWNESNILVHARVNDRSSMMGREEFDGLMAKVKEAVNAKSVTSLGSGAAEVAVDKGVLTEQEAARLSRARGWRNRFNENPPVNNDILFVEELQSDWHQKGRREGYVVPGHKEKVKANQSAIFDAEQRQDGFIRTLKGQNRNTPLYEKLTKNLDAVTDELTALYATRDQLALDSGTVPDAPFKSSWPKLVLKRLIRLAAENGQSQIAWTTGEQQAERYDLSKSIRSIILQKAPGDTRYLSAYDLNGRRVIDKMIGNDELADHIGKEAAQKLEAQEWKPYTTENSVGREVTQDSKILEGLDLKVGGEGMRGFYDKILVDVANGLGKKFGAKVSMVELSSLEPERAAFRKDAGLPPVEGEAGVKVHALEITPQMAEAALAGQPMFMPGMPVQHVSESGQPLEHAVGSGFINLIHFGDQGQREASPEKFGSSGATPRSELAGLPRSYFYKQGEFNRHDVVTRRSAVHGAKVSATRIYDADADVLNWGGQMNREKADQMLVDLGYVGLQRSAGRGKNAYTQVELYEPTPLKGLKTPATKFMPADMERKTPFIGEGIVSGWLTSDGDFKWGRSIADHERVAQALGFKSIEDIRDNHKALRVWADGSEKIITFNADTLQELPRLQRTALLDLAAEQGAALRDDRGNLLNEARFMPKAAPAVERALKNSAVRDADGSLKPLFHGTYSSFKKFAKGDLGYHFGTADAANARIGKAIADISADEITAAGAFDAFPEMRENMPPRGRGALETIADGSRTLPVFLDIRNPLRMEDVGPWDNPEEVLFALPKDVLKKLPKKVGDAVDAYKVWENDYSGPANKFNDAKVPQAAKALAAIREGLKSLGYDGVVYANAFEGRDANTSSRIKDIVPEDSYIAFDNKQIVPAFDTTGKAHFMPGKPRPGAKEWITDAAVKSGDQTFTGLAHFDAIQKMVEAIQSGQLPEDAMTKFKEGDDGWVTNTGRFLSREAARDLAERAGQISDESYAKAVEDTKGELNYGLESDAFARSRAFMPVPEKGGRDRKVPDGWLLPNGEHTSDLGGSGFHVSDVLSEYARDRGLPEWSMLVDSGAEEISGSPKAVKTLTEAGYPADLLRDPWEWAQSRGWIATRDGEFLDNGGDIEQRRVSKFLDRINARSPDIRYMPDAVAVPGQDKPVDVLQSRSWKELSKWLSPKEREKVRRDTAQSMVDIFESLPSDNQFEAAALAGLQKIGWYKRAASAIAHLFGPDADKFTVLVAAMSPQQSVQENMVMSLKIWNDWDKAGRPTDPQTVREIIERHAELEARTLNGVGALTGVLLQKNVTMLDDMAKISGYKVESFYRNLMNDVMAVTNDTWMSQFAGKALNFGNKADYAAFSAKIRRVAHNLGLDPREVQETIWSFFKTLSEASTVNKTAHKALREITDSDILKTPEFHDDLVQNPKIRAELERLGFTPEKLAGLTAREDARRPSPRPGSLADVAVREGGQGRLRLLERVADRAEAVALASRKAAAEKAAAKSRGAGTIAPDDTPPGESPF